MLQFGPAGCARRGRGLAVVCGRKWQSEADGSAEVLSRAGGSGCRHADVAVVSQGLLLTRSAGRLTW